MPGCPVYQTPVFCWSVPVQKQILWCPVFPDPMHSQQLWYLRGCHRIIFILQVFCHTKKAEAKNGKTSQIGKKRSWCTNPPTGLINFSWNVSDIWGLTDVSVSLVN